MSEPVTNDVSAPAHGRVVGLVAFLFGMSGREELPGVAVRRLLGDLGFSDDAARAALSRMTRGGQLVSERRGRTTAYRLAGSTARGFAYIRRRAAETEAQTEPAWDGDFHVVLHQVPETARAFRDALRRAAVLAGYGVLQPGVLIAPFDYADQLAAVLADRPADARVVFGRLSVPRAEAAGVMAEAYDLDAVAARYRAHASGLVELLGDPPADPADALRRFALTVSPALVATLGEPSVPLDVLPPDWPGPELRRLIAECGAVLGPRAAAHVAATLAGTPGARPGTA